ncbi:MAG: NAD(P)-dependent glycerol-3-phosphate dehydrogenase [Candidatus Omnitrophica bacterium]|nr:NAD(P)-dependent glycerol-3-phosphate dehydrogenase [Candidatus Omnitrophota bacterium]
MDKSIKKVTILGAGSWGTTLAIILSKNPGLSVNLWTAFPEQADNILSSRENKDFLPSIKIPRKVKVTSCLNDALQSQIIIVAVPVKFLRALLQEIKKTDTDYKDRIFLSVAKGIETWSLKTPSQIMKEELKLKKIAVLSGPTIAKEVVKSIPTVATIASLHKKSLSKLQRLFKGTPLRIYRSFDVTGTELAGALKNIIALACGISDGLGFGTNTKAALLTRGLVEIARLGKRLGARSSTFWGISGMGDLATTCFSPYSRNRFVGQEIGKGRKLKNIINEMKMVAEGITTVKSGFTLSKKLKIDMPITRQVYLVLYQNKKPLMAVKDLMSRPLKAE